MKHLNNTIGMGMVATENLDVLQVSKQTWAFRTRIYKVVLKA